jgi:hypothetical protein
MSPDQIAALMAKTGADIQLGPPENQPDEPLFDIGQHILARQSGAYLPGVVVKRALSSDKVAPATPIPGATITHTSTRAEKKDKINHTRGHSCT